MGILQTIRGPAEVRALDPEVLPDLAGEIREHLVREVCGHGGHLGSNLGVVELTIALHRVFHSPATPIVFDTGHQAYVHKMLTGRHEDFATLRRAGGLSGYPRRAESPHDLVENSHASTALSYAYGLSTALGINGSTGPVVAVVGDGAMTGGLAWEALNNLGHSGRPVIVLLNDNGRSYAPTVGALSTHLRRLRDRDGYAQVLARLSGTQDSSAESLDSPGSVFAALGLAYLGPVDGHDIAAVEACLHRARDLGRPALVHCLTDKGRGYPPAEQDEADRLHSVGRLQVSTGRPAQPPEGTWTDAFGCVLATLGAARPDVVALSAAMVGPTGLGEFARRFPGRCLDTGIAEQHAVTAASGMAMAGLHPVVAIYSTFAHRAFDQTLLDVGLHRLPVTFVLDRAGVTGPDGPSHHGLWDLALLGLVPSMRVAAPRDVVTLAEELVEAVLHQDGPTAVRFPKAVASQPRPACARWRGMDLLRQPVNPDVLLVPVGPLAEAACRAADLLASSGIRCTVVDPRWVLPVPPSLTELAAGHRLVVTIEDGVRVGGFGSRLTQLLADAGIEAPVRALGLPEQFLPHGERKAILRSHGLDAEGIADAARRGLRRTRREDLAADRAALAVGATRQGGG